MAALDMNSLDLSIVGVGCCGHVDDPRAKQAMPLVTVLSTGIRGQDALAVAYTGAEEPLKTRPRGFRWGTKTTPGASDCEQLPAGMRRQAATD
eukprot:Skav214750  [mRNA]  locus=scaffold983:174640:175162:- [translate_table: standard]